jgi:hypothetical protein
MSTPQTDAHWENQRTIVENFGAILSAFRRGEVNFDEVEDEIEVLRDDEFVEARTFAIIEQMWSDAQVADEMSQEMELERDEAYRKLQGGDVY